MNDCPHRSEPNARLIADAPALLEENKRLRMQCDANFMAGIEIGVRCHEKGMNLQGAIEFGGKRLEQYPTK